MDATEAFARFLDTMEWPHDMIVQGENGPLLPPREVLDRLVELRMGRDMYGDDAEAIRWCIETELGVLIWNVA